MNKIMEFLRNIFESRAFKLYLAGILLLSILSVMVVILVNYKALEKKRNEKDSKRVFSEKSIESFLEKPGLEDFIYPEDFFLMAPAFVLTREQKSQWNAGDVQEAWMNIEEETLFRLEDENKKMIELSLERIP